MVVLCQDGGNGLEFIQLVVAVTKQLGYRALINSIYNTNVRVHTSGRRMPEAKILGVIPRAGYVNGYGWADETLVFVDFSSTSILTFTQMIQQNRSRL